MKNQDNAPEKKQRAKPASDQSTENQAIKRKVTNPLEQAEYFGKEYSKNSELPDPSSRIQALAFGVVQVIAGERSVDQISQWVTDEVYQRVRARAVAAKLARRYGKNEPRYALNLQVRKVKTQSPRDGVVESVVLLSASDRIRAVAIRLEGLNRRWRATAISVI
jgi:hypothetical protein